MKGQHEPIQKQFLKFNGSHANIVTKIIITGLHEMFLRGWLADQMALPE